MLLRPRQQRLNSAINNDDENSSSSSTSSEEDLTTDEEQVVIVVNEKKNSRGKATSRKSRAQAKRKKIAKKEMDIMPYDFQRTHVRNLKNIFYRHDVALDTSGTGCGKTITTLLAAVDMDAELFIVCTKSAMTTWYDIIESMNLMGLVLTVVNYDTLRNCKWYDIRGYVEKNKITDYNGKESFWGNIKTSICPHVTRSETIETIAGGGQRRHINFNWNLPNNVLVVFDESHKGKNSPAQISKLIVGAKRHITDSNQSRVECIRGTCDCNYLSLKGNKYYSTNKFDDLDIKFTTATGNKNHDKYYDYGRTSEVLSLYQSKMRLGKKCPTIKKSGKKIILLTATPIEKTENICLIVYLLGYIDAPTPTVYKKWMVGKDIRTIHALLYRVKDFRAARMIMEDAKKETDYSHKCNIKAKVLTMDEETRQEIENCNNDIKEALEAQRQKILIDGRHPFVVIMRARQREEALKINSFISEAQTAMDDGYSAVIFLNFVDGIKIIENKLARYGVVKIAGGVSTEARRQAERDFESGKARLLITTIAAGNSSLSLHDRVGTAPRYSINGIPWSASTLRQMLGRTDRVGSKSDPTCVIIFCAGTIEESMALALNHKLQNIDIFNDGNCAQTLMDLLGEDVSKFDLSTTHAKYYTRIL